MWNLGPAGGRAGVQPRRAGRSRPSPSRRTTPPSPWPRRTSRVSIRNGDKEVKKLTLPAEARAVAFAPNGATVAVGLADNSVRAVHRRRRQGGEEHRRPRRAGDRPRATRRRETCSSRPGPTRRSGSGRRPTGRRRARSISPFVPGVGGRQQGRAQARGRRGEDRRPVHPRRQQAGRDDRDAGRRPRRGPVARTAQRVAAAGADNRVRVYGPDRQAPGSRSCTTARPPASPSTRTASGSCPRRPTSRCGCGPRPWSPQAAHAGPVRQVLVATDVARVLSVGDDKHLRIWDAKTGKEQKAIPAGDAAVVGAVVHDRRGEGRHRRGRQDGEGLDRRRRQGRRDVAAAGPGPGGRRLADRDAHRGRVHGGHCATSSACTTPPTGRELQSLPDPAGPVRSLAFLADNRTLVAAGDDKAVSVHDVAVTAALPVHAGGRRRRRPASRRPRRRSPPGPTRRSSCGTSPPARN